MSATCPKHTRDVLSDEDYKRTTTKKRADLKRGMQYSEQPKEVAAKVAQARLADLPLIELRHRAAAKKIAGRSKMTKQQLIEALQE